MFPLALRGYDREAVDAYVKRVNRLVTDLEASRSPEAAIRRALDQVGEETSSILQRAQETAHEITERSRAAAEDRFREAEREARALTAESEDRVRELEADYGAIWARRDHLLEQVRDLAERLLATADEAADRFPTQDDELIEGNRADTASFRQLEPPEEDTTVSVSYETDRARDFETGEEVPSADVEAPDEGREIRPEDEPSAGPPSQQAPGARAEPAGEDRSAVEEMDFVDPLDEADERDRDETPVRDFRTNPPLP